jgi:hypothetical protein
MTDLTSNLPLTVVSARDLRLHGSAALHWCQPRLQGSAFDAR